MKSSKTIFLSFFFLSLFFLNANTKNISDLTIIHTVLNDPNSFFYLNLKKGKNLDQRLPIGVFDSGTGGLTVLDVILNYDKFNNSSHTFNTKGDGLKDFTKESFIYLGDQANMPYGIYSKENNSRLLREHIVKDVQFLLGNKYYQSSQSTEYETNKQTVKTIVIACNTATAYGKKDIEEFIKQSGLNIKVIGVIGAGIRGALKIFKGDRNGSLGILATLGTVHSNGYLKNLKSSSKNQTGIENITAIQQAGVGLAGAIDKTIEYINHKAISPRSIYKGPSLKNKDAKIDIKILNRYNFNWKNNAILFSGTRKAPGNIQLNSVENYISYHLVSLLEIVKKQKHIQPLKAIILGCTHYPFYKDNFKKQLNNLYNYKENNIYIYRPFMSQNIVLIDPAENTAKELYLHLAKYNLIKKSSTNMSEFYLSVPNIQNSNLKLDSQNNLTYRYKYGRKAGNIQQYVKRIPFSKKNLPSNTIFRLKQKVPRIHQLIKKFHWNNLKTKFLHPEYRF